APYGSAVSRSTQDNLSPIAPSDRTDTGRPFDSIARNGWFRRPAMPHPAEADPSRIMNIEPFQIATPEADLINLKDRLARTRWPQDFCSAGWRQGTNRSYLRELVTYWEHQFDWRRQEAMLNAFSHFRAD